MTNQEAIKILVRILYGDGGKNPDWTEDARTALRMAAKALNAMDEITKASSTSCNATGMLMQGSNVHGMTLKQLLLAIDSELESDSSKIQICEYDWDTYSEFPLCSRLLEPYYDRRIVCLEAIKEDVIRVEIEDKE